MAEIDPWLVFPRYCKHRKVIDDYCELCEWEEMQDERGEGFAFFRWHALHFEPAMSSCPGHSDYLCRSMWARQRSLQSDEVHS